MCLSLGGRASDLAFVTLAVRLANADRISRGDRVMRYVVSDDDRTLEGELLVTDVLVPDGAMYVSELIALLPERDRNVLLFSKKLSNGEFRL